MDEKVCINNKNCTTIIAEMLVEFLKESIEENIVFICIGTDRSTGDSLGPLVGTFLEDHCCKYPVYGTLDKPLHGKNIDKYIEEINSKYTNSKIVVIDACLENIENVANIVIKKAAIKPGNGVGKDFSAIGDISITGIVNSLSICNFITLQSTRLHLVYTMAQKIAQGIMNFILIRESF